MQLNFADKIRKLRKDANLTQEQLANDLGVSSQSISKWECGDGYPDITLLPVIANYFSTSIDELLSNETTKNKDIESFLNRFFATDGRERIELAIEYYHKYPTEYSIADWLCCAIVEEKYYIDDYLHIMREASQRVLKHCTNSVIRNNIITYMCQVCPDNELDEWLSLCPKAYCTYNGEVLEARLWQKGRYDESRLQFDLNSLEIMMHILGRHCRNQGEPERHAEWCKYRMKLIESFSENGDIPDAWLGYYSGLSFRAGCAMFGCGNVDEGYIYLERAFEFQSRWLDIPENTLLETGNKWIFGGIKLYKSGVANYEFVLPDGTHKPNNNYGWLFYITKDYFYTCMTRPHGWEWFDGIRNDERFKQLVERAKIVAEYTKTP